MITCKEDLVNTYIVNDCDVKRERYLELCEKFDIDWGGSCKQASKFIPTRSYCLCNGFELWQTDSVDGKGLKQLKLSDLFPENLVNTKVYSTDEEVVRMYAELIGVNYKMDHEKYSAAGYAYREMTLCVECFRSGYKVDKFWGEITEPQIRALHREKFPDQYAERESQYAVLRKGGRYTFEHGKPVDFGDVVGCFKCSDSVKPLPSTFFDEPKDNEVKFDYELIGRIGATHYSTNHRELYKVINGELMFWYNFGERWEATTKTKAEVLLLIKPIPPKPQTKFTYELVTDMDTNEIAKAMIDGEVFYSKDGVLGYKWNGESFCEVDDESENVDILVTGDYYRRVETEVDWLDCLDEFLYGSGVYAYVIKENKIKISGYIDSDKFAEMCRVALKGMGELE